MQRVRAQDSGRLAQRSVHTLLHQGVEGAGQVMMMMIMMSSAEQEIRRDIEQLIVRWDAEDITLETAVDGIMEIIHSNFE
jgi:hypothetical protein